MIIANPVPDWEKVLSNTEQHLVLVFKEHGPVMRRDKIEQICLDLGMNYGTFQIYLGYSPIMTRWGIGVYSLRGAQVPPGLIQSMVSKPKRRRGGVTVDYGWTQSSKLWIAYRLSESIIRSGVGTVPAALRKFIQDKFALKTADGLDIGSLVARENSIWGFGPFFRRRGGEPGDYLVTIFDTSSREAIVHIGDSSLLDDLKLTAG